MLLGVTVTVGDLTQMSCAIVRIVFMLLCYDVNMATNTVHLADDSSHNTIGFYRSYYRITR